ncbi:hypothetical protein AYI69_g9723 [Smittium culicis]|uniref:Uncharacterized protein n=1 Tax=Smittium culicis TaxID=133412 RepID=A0A1R1XAT9_9FUNG|nr:hypothetical protein AYI69_g9723 [Smittium culicis]
MTEFIVKHPKRIVSSPVRTPSIFGADYEEDFDLQQQELCHCYAHISIPEFTTENLAPSDLLEITEKRRKSVDFDLQGPITTLVGSVKSSIKSFKKSL